MVKLGKHFVNIWTSSGHYTLGHYNLLTVDQMLFYEIGLIMLKIHEKSFAECFNEFFTETTHAMTTRSNRSFNIENPRIQLTKQSLNYKA